MDESFFFLNLEGLDDGQVKAIKSLLNPSNHNCQVELPWSIIKEEPKATLKGSSSWLNVHAPEFRSSCAIKMNSHALGMHNFVPIPNTPHPSNNVGINNNDTSSINYVQNHAPLLPFNNPENIQPQHIITNVNHSMQLENIKTNTINHYTENFQTNGNSVNSSQNVHCPQNSIPVNEFKLNPAVSSFVPQQITCLEQTQVSNGMQNFESHVPKIESNTFQNTVLKTNETLNNNEQESNSLKNDSIISQDTINEEDKNGSPVSNELSSTVKQTVSTQNQNLQASNLQPEEKPPVASAPPVVSTPPVRSWADVLKGDLPKAPPPKVLVENGNKVAKQVNEEKETESLSVEEDKLALTLGKHLYQMTLNFQPVFLQSRGLVNKRNWCYINATLQALISCPPFYSLLRNLPLGPGVDRGKSATPVTDSMVKVAYEFEQLSSPQEDLQTGQPFQPDFIYEMLRDLKSDCLKGQQEDAEEFLSFILNGMHEEMVRIIKHYEKVHNISNVEDVKVNGDVSEGEEEWHVIRQKYKGMITRKVAEHKTPISDLIGGTKSFLTTCGSKTTASVQPFFTLQLDIQSENVTSVSEALNRMAVKEPIQGYTCAKTKQEIEAFSHISLQKLPPILILHLKRFVYNKNGCKKVMKKTDYPIHLELDKELFSPDVRRSQRFRSYKLFAVMYHDGEEAIKGHYVSDVYNHGSQTWIRCDDRSISPVTEEQVLSHNPPRVPYLLFYQENVCKNNTPSSDSTRTSCR